jgi:electron transfer flavoprotein beta subunit
MPTESTNRPLTSIVCIKYTLDVEEIKVNPVTSEPNLEHATYRINDFDENGIEAALRLRDEHGGRAVAVSVLAERPPDNVLLRALAMGIDELHFVCDPALRDCDALATAAILAALILKLGTFDCVVCSDTSVDEHRGEVGPRLAEDLQIPSVTHVTGLTVNDNLLRADRALESWIETVEAALPVLLTVGSETNEPRMPTLRQIRQADQKPTVEWRLTDLVSPHVYGDSGSRIRTLATYAPPSVRKRIVVNGEDAEETAGTLVAHLLEEAVITF